MSNICGLNYVLKVPNFLLNKCKKVKDYFRENQALLTGYLKHQTQLIAKGNSVLGGFALPGCVCNLAEVVPTLGCDRLLPFQAGE